MLKPRLLASVALLGSLELERDTVRTINRIVFRMVQPATLGARMLGCGCIGPRQFIDNCPYHGITARRLCHG